MRSSVQLERKLELDIELSQKKLKYKIYIEISQQMLKLLISFFNCNILFLIVFKSMSFKFHFYVSTYKKYRIKVLIFTILKLRLAQDVKRGSARAHEVSRSRSPKHLQCYQIWFFLRLGIWLRIWLCLEKFGIKTSIFSDNTVICGQVK